MTLSHSKGEDIVTEEIIEKCNELKLKGFAAHIEEALVYGQEKNWSYKRLLLHLMAKDFKHCLKTLRLFIFRTQDAKSG